MLKKFDMSKILSFGLVFLIVLSVALSTGNSALANPNFCPPGQQENCVLAQHRVTGECQWFPSHAINPPWITVEGGVCPEIVVPTSESETATLAAPVTPIEAALGCPNVRVDVAYPDHRETKTFAMTTVFGDSYSIGFVEGTEITFTPSEAVNLELPSEQKILTSITTWITEVNHDEVITFKKFNGKETCIVEFLARVKP